MQFVCQKIGEPAMGDMRYISFAVVMGSCVLFSSLLGVVLGEWKGTGAKTRCALAGGILVLALSIGVAVAAKSL
jgi:putative Mn2+ efflux pump MntP